MSDQKLYHSEEKNIPYFVIELIGVNLLLSPINFYIFFVISGNAANCSFRGAFVTIVCCLVLIFFQLISFGLLAKFNFPTARRY